MNVEFHSHFSLFIICCLSWKLNFEVLPQELQCYPFQTYSILHKILTVGPSFVVSIEGHEFTVHLEQKHLRKFQTYPQEHERYPFRTRTNSKRTSLLNLPNETGSQPAYQNSKNIWRYKNIFFLKKRHWIWQAVVTCTITGDRAANIDLSWTPIAF